MKNFDSLKNKTQLPKSYMLQLVRGYFQNGIDENEVKYIEKEFNDNIDRIKIVFGANTTLGSLINDNPNRRTVYPSLMLLDVIIVLFMNEDEKFLIRYRDEIYGMFESFFKDETNRAFIQNSKRGKHKINNTLGDRVDFIKEKTLDHVRKKYNVNKNKRIAIRDLELKDKLVKKQNGICLYCKNQIKPNDDYEIDHIQPLDDYGDNLEINLPVLHKKCNREKSNKNILF